MDTITLKEANQLLYSGVEVDIRYITCDFTRNKGGDIKEYCQAKLNLSNDTKSQIKSTAPNKIKQTPITHNIVLQNGEIRTIYRMGITHINDKQILI